MRRLHRWIMTVFALLLIYWVGSGLVLQVYDYTDSDAAFAREGGGPGGATPGNILGLAVANAVPLEPTALEGALTVALAAVDRLAPGALLASLEMHVAPRGPAVTVRTLGGEATEIQIDVASGEVVGHKPVAGPAPSPASEPGGSHGTIKRWHRGLNFGVPGAWASFASGGAFILLCLTGIVLYFQSRAASRRSATARPRWTLRTLHRTIAIVAAAFLLNLAITGTILAWGSIGDARRTAANLRTAAPLPRAELARLWRAVYDVAHAAGASSPIIAQRLSMGDGEPRGAVSFGAPHSGALFLDPVRRGYLIGPAGATTPGDAALDTHSFLKRLHRGDVIGSVHGRAMVILAGTSALFLLVSGLWMYAQMLVARRRMNRPGWFWK